MSHLLSVNEFVKGMVALGFTHGQTENLLAGRRKQAKLDCVHTGRAYPAQLCLMLEVVLYRAKDTPYETLHEWYVKP